MCDVSGLIYLSKMKYDKKLMIEAVENNGCEVENEFVEIVKERLKTLQNIEIVKEYPNGKKYTIMIFTRDTTTAENFMLFGNLH